MIKKWKYRTKNKKKMKINFKILRGNSKEINSHKSHNNSNKETFLKKIIFTNKIQIII